MDLTFVELRNLKSLEELIVFLGGARRELKTILIVQVKAIKSGAMPEDMNVRGAHMVGVIQDLMKLYDQQIDAALELVPKPFSPEKVIAKLQREEARWLKSKEKEECDT